MQKCLITINQDRSFVNCTSSIDVGWISLSMPSGRLIETRANIYFYNSRQILFNPPVRAHPNSRAFCER